ncbi:HopJ type III effector protein [Paraglaciecola arctica]|uniref:HopJ type III effector protein n=1 Tax=Paraglaciecola arctica BSs20135 TaxID=493475 RepID=K6YGZ8_9ALTE|nr:HopJ type III effector protein [Paraglaciecola arctica]GAC17432.1 hypothetical protein GARC_0450 [Paraglaciecola arctica BSs20135]
MTINELLTQLRKAPDSIEFTEVMLVISQFYTYTATDFSNGTLLNIAGTNEGSCKIFYFAQLHQLSESETLSLFGTYYRKDVLENTSGTDHGNIRNFMITGWAGIKFADSPLTNIIKQTL